MKIELLLCFVNIWILKMANNAALYKGGKWTKWVYNATSNEKKEFCDKMMGPLYVKVVFMYIYFY